MPPRQSAPPPEICASICFRFCGRAARRSARPRRTSKSSARAAGWNTVGRRRRLRAGLSAQKHRDSGWPSDMERRVYPLHRLSEPLSGRGDRVRKENRGKTPLPQQQNLPGNGLNRSVPIRKAPARRAAAQGPFRAGSQKEICYSAVRVSYRVNLIVLISNGRSARRSFFSLCTSPSSRSSRLHSHQLLKGKAVGMVTEV